MAREIEGKPSPRVYIAAASAEMDRAKAVRRALRAAGVITVETWIENIERVGATNPATATKRQRAGWALGCLTEASTADIVLLLAPNKRTAGAWVELGFCYGLAKPLVAAGDTKQSVFCALADEYDSDEDAIAVILSRFDLTTGAFA